jgi:hypothetical protein
MEKPKEEHKCTCNIKKEEPKQETVEEAAKEFVLSHDFSLLTNPNHLANRCFQYGAKWQAERMYSDEEVKHIISEALQSALVTVDLEQWFKQFKKK